MKIKYKTKNNKINFTISFYLLYMDIKMTDLNKLGAENLAPNNVSLEGTKFQALKELSTEKLPEVISEE
ncbi:hypothetical protein IKI14_05325 [bacterium]|nr:hypothetical protein [bacterium]